ncbi:MAG: phosphoribosyltransferase [Acidobacteria bacterium]|nr:phosphoribosyltransferase [Acidobacteriota bacterium]
MFRTFENREEAGADLAERLSEFAGRTDAIVLGLPRGGVPVAFEVATRLRLPLDVFVVRKLGVPWQPELAFGAIATGGTRVLNDGIVRSCQISEEQIEAVTAFEREEIVRREADYRGLRPPPRLKGKAVILVDDGLATGATMRAAVQAVRAKHPARIVVGVPVGAAETCRELDEMSDVKCVCSATPEPFYGVGMWYRDFSQTTDDEVLDLLARAEAIGQNGQATVAR